MHGDRKADLVLEGGGVKGVALAGAVSRLAGEGYGFPRIAGTSAGAILGAVTAALQLAGESLTYVRDVALSLDYRRFADRGPLGSAAGPLQPVVDLGSLLVDHGIYRGDALHEFITSQLAQLGVRTWADLRLSEDEGTSLEEDHRYALVITVSDVARRKLVMLPWDYRDYGLDPDSQPVADAVRMSASLPFFYEPVSLKSSYGESVMVDGGLLSNYPIKAFDRTDEKPPRWPTFGVKLSRRPPMVPRTREVGGLLSYLVAIADTVHGANDAMNIEDPAVRARTIFVDVGAVKATDFDLDEETRISMLDAADQATREFLEKWDFAEYVRRYRGVSA
ncbi:MAG: hypothetical protein GEV07_25010 [Streptosporangiales bacterium]|nr:hypothetical protein [Streptosporangiales bacterium]